MALERKGGEIIGFEEWEGCSVVVVVVVHGGGGVNGVVVVSNFRRESSEGGDSHGGGMMLARRCRLRRRANQRGMLLRYGGWRGGIGPYMEKGWSELVSVWGSFIFYFYIKFCQKKKKEGRGDG